MASDHYKKSLSELQEYFGISYPCAQYLYHRALRARRDGDKYLEWTLQLQNALVKADKCLGMNWERIIFGQEEENLMSHGIIIDEMENTVFRWNLLDNNVPEVETDPSWTVVGKKKKKKEKGLLASKIGIYT